MDGQYRWKERRLELVNGLEATNYGKTFDFTESDEEIYAKLCDKWHDLLEIIKVF